MKESIKHEDYFFRWHRNFHFYFVLLFENLAALIFRFYWLFILVPVLLTSFSIPGLVKLIPSHDSNILMLPDKGNWNDEKKSVDEYFGKKDDGSEELFDVFRATQLGQYLNILVTSNNNESNILKSKVWSSIVNLNEEITNLAVKDGNESSTFTYQDICLKWKGKCFPALYPISPDTITMLGSAIQMLPKFLNISAPDFVPAMKFYIGYNLGKPKFNEKGILISAKSITLYYWLQNDNEKHQQRYIHSMFVFIFC